MERDEAFAPLMAAASGFIARCAAPVLQIAADQSEPVSLPLTEEAGGLPLRPGSGDWSPAACRESLSALALLATSRWMA